MASARSSWATSCVSRTVAPGRTSRLRTTPSAGAISATRRHRLEHRGDVITLGHGQLERDRLDRGRSGQSLPPPRPRADQANASRPPHPPDHHGAPRSVPNPWKPVPCSPHHRNSTASTRQQGDHGGLEAEVQSKPTCSPRPYRSPSCDPTDCRTQSLRRGDTPNPWVSQRRKPRRNPVWWVSFPPTLSNQLSASH